MKYLSIIIGGLLSLSGISRLSIYIFDYNQLTQYGKGYIWGNVLMVVFGISLIYWGFRAYYKAN